MNVTELENDPDIVAENLAQVNFEKNNGGQNGNEKSIVPSSSTATSKPYRFIPLKLSGNSFAGCHKTAELLEEVGGEEAILKITKIFYERAFEDSLLDTFIRSHNDPHFSRLGQWIVEKMDPSQKVWTQERAIRNANPKYVTVAGGHEHLVHDRSSAHAAAWYSPKRPREEVGNHFMLHDARVWMRLMFWSARETGVFARSPTFEEWFVKFIAHFMRVYERTAPQFARESLRWSEDPANIKAYLASKQSRKVGNTTGLYYSMPDEICKPGSLDVARRQLPSHELAESTNWPYHQAPLRDSA